ncbi:MAG: hypothetical protein KF729_05705 [Sandaracinaceae bacterium]|nr:hypothetical protein [Sandaracinaceae bacterium]
MTRGQRARRLALALALATCGCARNAVFELELDLPPQPVSVVPLFVVIQVANDRGFDEDWAPLERLDGVALRATCARPLRPPACEVRELAPDCSMVVSVLGDEDDFARPLRVRARFCEDDACTSARDALAPEARVELERVFYRGRYTQARVCVDTVPISPAPEPTRIERCDVRCRDGDAVMHCRADGTHFCEAP